MEAFTFMLVDDVDEAFSQRRPVHIVISQTASSLFFTEALHCLYLGTKFETKGGRCKEVLDMAS